MNKKNVNFIVDAIHNLTEGMKELTEDSDRAFHNLTEGMKELTEKVEELKNSIDDGGVSKPEDGQEYWYISGSGEVYMDQWNNCPINHDRHSIGNCFPTEQAAEDAFRVLKLIPKAKESQDGFVPDWENWEQNKYALYEMGDIHIMQYTSRNIAPIFGFWEDKSVCEEFIKDNHDELIWFFKEYQR